ncbi:MAG TPA: MarR family transcriptional regulator [Bacillota bacterium]|nr:MarR family transcriptional regulator [Bacillota bacterium]
MVKQYIENMTYQVISEFAKTIERFGLSPLDARLFAYLYTEKEPKTLDDMGDALGKSKTSMSTSIRNLSQQNLVKRVWKKGCRKNLYEADTNLFNLFIISQINQWLDFTKQQKRTLVHLKSQCNEQTINDEEKLIQQQLDQIIAFHTQIETFIQDIKQTQKSNE